MTTERISKKYGVCTATLTVWANKAGLPLRHRGRRRMTEPTPRQRSIVEMARICTYDAIADRFGITKQGVYRIVRRWKSAVETPKPNSLSVPAAPEQSDIPAEPLTESDITGDIERVITKAVAPYIDESNPMLHFDELKAECRAKLARILDAGRLANCPTRAKQFAFLKTCFLNHLRSLVQKHAFTTKRTGVKAVQSRDDTFSRPKLCVFSLDDEMAPVQVGADDPRFRQSDFLDELAWQLSPTEWQELQSLMRDELEIEKPARTALFLRCRAILTG